MTRKLRKRAEEKAGFLFISGNLAIDFVNTRPVLRGRLTELLPDFASVLRWFVAARLLDQKSAATLARRRANTPQAKASWRLLLAFREQLRHALLLLESGHALPPKMVADVNHLLARHPLPAQLAYVKGVLHRGRRFQPKSPADLFAPLADAAADLFVSIDPSRLRQCETCVLHFHDTSKNATRRWCSMRLCGNRAKVAKYAARHPSS